MHIPRVWAKVSADEKLPDGKTIPISVWGWGDDESSAKTGGADRLKKVLARVRRGEPFPEKYGYGSRPPREEILQQIDSSTRSEPAAILTRNSYGAQILNAERLLFLDIDFERPSIFQRLSQLFGGASTEVTALATLRDALQKYRRATFRIYRTAAGLRVIAIDREFDPARREAQDLMQATATDPAFARLCRAQNSFRARLTPKPWRCDCSVPPGQHPREEGELRHAFALWLTEYERASMRYATCRYLETIGDGSASGDAKRLLEVHDRVTRCNESLPLA